MSEDLHTLVVSLQRLAVAAERLADALGACQSPSLYGLPESRSTVQGAPARTLVRARGSLRAACPYCYAQPGWRCRTAQGGEARRAHKDRRRAVYGRSKGDAR